MWAWAVLVGVLAVALFVVAILEFRPGEWAVGAQIAGGTTAFLVGSLGAATFLVRKKQRREALPWEIRLRARSFELGVRAAGDPLANVVYPWGEPITREGTKTLFTENWEWYEDDPVKRHALFFEIREIALLIDEYTFWRRVFWPWRKPETF